jgi:hypothetical protein
LVAVVFSWQFATSACAQATLSSPGIDSFDCVTAFEVEEDTTQVWGNSPNPWNDLDEISLQLNDKAVIPSRSSQETPQTTSTTADTIVLCRPGVIPAFLLPTHFSESLHEHIRERAPPILS